MIDTAPIDDFSSYSNEELINMYHECIHLALIYNIFQLAKKILLNSLYGAIGNNFFRYYNRDMARSITLMGQCMINKAALIKNKFISAILGEKEVKDRRIYSDTDSVIGSTNVFVSIPNGYAYQMPIKIFYDLAKGEETSDDGKFVKHLNEVQYSTMSVSPEGYNTFTDIIRVMKHKVMKRMFKVSLNDSDCHTIMTEDHSIMVMRDGEMLEISPRDIRENDQLILSYNEDILE